MNFVIFASIIAVLALAVSGAELEDRGRIFNGRDANQAQFKYMAALAIANSKFFGLISKVGTCGGTIIGPNWILTAAHCLDGASKVRVYLGLVGTDDAEVAYSVDKRKIFLHPDWNIINKLNDIALILIPQTNCCDKIAYARLPHANIFHPQDMIVIAMGWGRKSDNGPLADHLQWTRMAVMSNDECKNYVYDITEKHFCGNTSSPFGSACKGDSGGPLVLANTREQIGIVSVISNEGCMDGAPVICTSVSSYLPWIAALTGLSL